MRRLLIQVGALGLTQQLGHLPGQNTAGEGNSGLGMALAGLVMISLSPSRG